MSDVSVEELAARIAEPGLHVLDVRGRAEYEGLVVAPCDPRPGRIPGARHLDVASLFGLAPEEVRVLVGAAPGAEVIAYCHSGNRSAIAVEILRSAGFAARNYRGSWHEWSRDPDLPVEVG